MVAIGLPTFVILTLIFLWPSLYHYEAITMDGRQYPLRINRITSHTTYYNGNQWLVPPVQVEMRQPKAAPAAPQQPVQPVQPLPSPQSTTPVQPVSPVPPLQSAQTVQTDQSTQTFKPLQQPPPAQPPLPSNSSKGKITLGNMPSSPPPPKQEPRAAKKTVLQPPTRDAKVNDSKPYSIQITAYPEKDKADALSKQLSRQNINVRVEEVTVKGKGRWHRVLLGRFKNRTEARKYLNEHEIGKLYPQSFIQKS